MVGYYSNQKNKPAIGTSDWSLVYYNFTVPENTKEIWIRAGIGSREMFGGKVWFDDIKIE